MTNLIEINGIKLTPVIEFFPTDFSRKDRKMPDGGAACAEWEPYWKSCLADSGVKGLNPIERGSCYVATSDISTEQLARSLPVFLEDCGGLAELHHADSRPILSGGLALSAYRHGILVLPTCCSDLSNLESWQTAAGYTGHSWEMLWIGHPWLSVKFQQPWLVLSDLHESDDPEARWMVDPADLRNAIIVAEEELNRFKEQLAQVLTDLGFVGNAMQVAADLSGFRSAESNP
ncbi:hypothetical protein V6x_00740 [Gimesia chilikensis]|uniref:Uncharacterized protein n=1 Tax=Gimesia chilikensis TaxID=2605989 RepID=A0A517W580_9PLAN|nr:hypothetical protein [Gimesia chilikensis]QDU00401.1 hypothetical protein V6x_00740 [Gimesia chilikensis]